jgi:hypothetical protein
MRIPELNRNNVKRELKNFLSDSVLNTDEAKRLDDFLKEDLFNVREITRSNLSKLRSAI